MMDLKITPSVQTIVKLTALGPVANTDTKLLIDGLFQKGRILAQDGVSSLHLPKGHLNPPSRSDTCSSSAEGVASWLRAAPIYKKLSWIIGSLGAPAQNELARSAAERPWPNHGGGQRWSLTRSPLRRTIPPLMPRVPTIITMKDNATDLASPDRDRNPLTRVSCCTRRPRSRRLCAEAPAYKFLESPVLSYSRKLLYCRNLTNREAHHRNRWTELLRMGAQYMLYVSYTIA